MVPQFFVRPEHDQWNLIRACGPAAFDGAVISARYIAPFPKHDKRFGKDPRRLVDAIQEHGAPWVVDLATDGLCDADVVNAPSWARLREAEYARLFPLPLDAAVLDDGEARNAFVDAALRLQVGAPIPSAPYLEFDRDDDPRLEANLAMLGRVVGAAQGRVAAGFVQVALESLNRGLLVKVARRYAETGVKLVFLRVRSLPSESATPRQLGHYLDAVAAFKAAGIAVIADQSAHFGAAAVAGGAAGFCGGERFFHNVPRRQVHLGGGGGGQKFPVELPGRLSTVPRDALPANFTCPVPDCALAAGDDSTAAIREHNLHYFKYLAALSAAELVRELRDSGQPQAVAWADELERRARRSA